MLTFLLLSRQVHTECGLVTAGFPQDSGGRSRRYRHSFETVHMVADRSSNHPSSPRPSHVTILASRRRTSEHLDDFDILLVRWRFWRCHLGSERGSTPRS